MSEDEGEFKKRLVPKNIWHEDDLGKWANPTTLEYSRFITKVIEDAKQEFPLEMLKDHDIDGIDIVLDWFKKWFGGEML